MTGILLKACGIFYAVLCVFSIVTGLMYASGRRDLNPLELSDRFMSRYQDPEKLKKFTVRMGWVTFVVGIVQGITAYAVLQAGNLLHYLTAVGFTLFSIASVAFKLKGKISLFPVVKSAAYLAILVILVLSRHLFF